MPIPEMPNISRMGQMGRKKIVGNPFQVIGLDLIEPLPPFRNHYKEILMVSDWFSKYALLYLSRSAKAHFSDEHLENSVYVMSGFSPHVIIMIILLSFQDEH